MIRVLIILLATACRSGVWWRACCSTRWASSGWCYSTSSTATPNGWRLVGSLHTHIHTLLTHARSWEGKTELIINQLLSPILSMESFGFVYKKQTWLPKP